MKKRICLIVLILMIVCVTAACGGKTAQVSINDDGLKTELEVKLPNTVGKIIEEAGISVAEDDVVTPDLSEKLSEPAEITISRKHNVTLTAGGKTESFSIVGGTVADLLEAANVKLGDNQLANFDLTEPLKEGMAVEILDQLNVKITCDGKTKTETVNSAVVSEVLKELGITLGGDDEVTPSKDSRVTDGMEIVVDRVKYETEVVTESIAYEVSYEYDSSASEGTEYMSVYGEEGEKEVTYKVKFVNGKEDEREIVEEKVITEPKDAVVVIGTYSGPVEVARRNCPNCNNDGHGYYEVDYQYPDGHIETVYEEY